MWSLILHTANQCHLKRNHGLLNSKNSEIFFRIPCSQNSQITIFGWVLRWNFRYSRCSKFRDQRMNEIKEKKCWFFCWIKFLRKTKPFYGTFLYIAHSSRCGCEAIKRKHNLFSFQILFAILWCCGAVLGGCVCVHLSHLN